MKITITTHNFETIAGLREDIQNLSFSKLKITKSSAKKRNSKSVYIS